MELFERIEVIITHEKLTKNKLCKRLGVPQNTFGRYFTKGNQNKLVIHLWTLLALYPEISRDWLFFGEGEMLRSDAPALDAPAGHDETAALRQRIADLEKTIAAQDETLALYRRMETPKTAEGKETAAPGSGSAAPSEH